jgi:hypothetical protein
VASCLGIGVLGADAAAVWTDEKEIETETEIEIEIEREREREPQKNLA